MIYGARPRRCAVACRRVGLGRKGIGLKVHINESVNKLRLQVTLFNDKQVRRFSFRFQSAGFFGFVHFGVVPFCGRQLDVCQTDADTKHTAKVPSDQIGKLLQR